MTRDWAIAAASVLALGLLAGPDADARRGRGGEPRQYEPPFRPSSKRKAALLDKSLRRSTHP